MVFLNLPQRHRAAARNLVIVLFLSVMSACQSFDHRPDQDFKAPKVDGAVGVVSLLGDSFHGIKRGSNVFSSTYYEADVSSWDIDQFVEDTAIEYLSGRRFYDVQTLPEEGENRASLFPTGIRSNEDKERLFDFAERQGWKSVVVFTPQKYSREPIYRSPFGFIENQVFGLISRRVYCLFKIRIFDVQGRTELGNYWVLPRTVIDESLPEWRSDFSQFSDSEKSAIKAKLHSHLSDSVTEVLSNAFSTK